MTIRGIRPEFFGTVPNFHGLSINQSIKSSICKAPLNQSSQRRLLRVGLHKEPSLKARLELFATNITVLEMRWQRVPNLGCRDAETARTITCGLSNVTWLDATSSAP